MRKDNGLQKWYGWTLLVFAAAVGPVGLTNPQILGAFAFQEEVEVSSEATPEIRQIKPEQAAASTEVTVEIEGRNFSRGVYVSFSHPAVHVISTRRAGATRLASKLAIAKKAPSGTISLYVSNPAGSVAEAPFTITGGTPLVPAAAAPAPAAAETRPAEAAMPEVTGVDPPRASQGSELSVKVTGKNFAPGTKVAFSNPGVRLLETTVAKPSELTARIRIAADAPTGSSGLFVVNPDERETEVPFEIVAATPPATTAATQPAAAATAPAAAESPGAGALRFEVLNLGEGVQILQSLNKPRGTLTLAAGKLKYEEAGKEVFSAAPGDIKEIEANTILGVNTGTFRLILKSGKTFNFAPASLRPADGQAIMDSIRQALK